MDEELELVIKQLSENLDLREEVIYWLSENGYLDNFKISVYGSDD